MKRMLLLSAMALALMSSAQELESVRFAYSAPYAIHVGTRVSTLHRLHREIQTNDQGRSFQRDFLVSPQLGYSWQPQVQQVLYLGIEADYRLGKTDKRSYWMGGLGWNFATTFTREGGEVNIGTGELEYQTTNAFSAIPYTAIEWGFHPKNRVGWHLRGWYGQQLNFSSRNESWFGLEFGLSWKLEKNEE
ncbi:hypothetical protein HZ996_02860 [Cryomorphaceae bacterium]|nr:hypothetical protein HZ996_02860 [Cryomorphaceae bacterium]